MTVQIDQSADLRRAVPNRATETPPRPTVEASTALTRSVVRVVADHTGRGPTKVRVTVGPDVMCVVMSDNHTKGERALVANGEHALVADVRRAMHRAMQPALRQAARAASGREIQAVLTDHAPRPDISTFTFVLAPLGLQEEGRLAAASPPNRTR